MLNGDCRTLMTDCASGRSVETWREFDRVFRSRLLVGVRRALARYGRRLDAPEAEDYLQDVYCRLLERDSAVLRRCRGANEAQIGYYLQRVAERVALDRLRASVASVRGGGRLLSTTGREAIADWYATEGTSSPEERALSAERRRLFFAKCRRVCGPKRPRRDLWVVYLALFEGWTSREIAGRLGDGTTPEGIDSLIYRVKRRLREREGLRLPDRGSRLGGSAA